MKAKVISIVVILMLLGLVYTLFPTISNNFGLIINNLKTRLEYRNQINSDNNNLKTVKISERIYIEGNSGWSDFRDDGKCTGQGTFSDPYVIEDLIIDAGVSESGILIRNSDVYFRIENCTVYNAFYAMAGGIDLTNVKNSQLIDNNCSSNYIGIKFFQSENNTVSGNTLDNNEYGIFLTYSENNFISGNNVSNPTINPQGRVIHGQQGIYFYFCINNIVSGNNMNGCGLVLDGPLIYLSSNEIDTTNLVNEKPLYYYTNEINLDASNFTNAGQVILVNCNGSLISNLNTSYCYKGISLNYCNDNDIDHNIANYNFYGIYLFESDSNRISENIANSSYYGIQLDKSDFNTVNGNNVNYSYFGVYILDSNNGVISDNILNFNYEGIRLYNCDFNLISGNTAYYNNDGITIWYSHDNIISRNTGINNDAEAIDLIYSDYNIISRNNASHNARGIGLGWSDFNIISDNTANNNKWDGIFLYDSDNNVIIGNTANNHRYSGIYLGYSDYNIVSGNNFMYNEYCIMEKNCVENQFSNNRILCFYNQRIIFMIALGFSIFGGLLVLSIIFYRLIKVKKKRE
ncbi:MAG: NosD domain-containing protein [Candidatus Thorarchaeota archaeon]